MGTAPRGVQPRFHQKRTFVPGRFYRRGDANVASPVGIRKREKLQPQTVPESKRAVDELAFEPAVIAVRQVGVAYRVPADGNPGTLAQAIEVVPIHHLLVSKIAIPLESVTNFAQHSCPFIWRSLAVQSGERTDGPHSLTNGFKRHAGDVVPERSFEKGRAGDGSEQLLKPEHFAIHRGSIDEGCRGQAESIQKRQQPFGKVLVTVVESQHQGIRVETLPPRDRFKEFAWRDESEPASQIFEHGFEFRHGRLAHVARIVIGAHFVGKNAMKTDDAAAVESSRLQESCDGGRPCEIQSLTDKRFEMRENTTASRGEHYVTAVSTSDQTLRY